MYLLPTPHRCLWSLLGTLLVCLPLTALAAPAAHYTVLDLGPGFVHALTPDNIAVGASPATREQATLFTPTPQLITIVLASRWALPAQALLAAKRIPRSGMPMAPWRTSAPPPGIRASSVRRRTSSMPTFR